MEEPKQARKSSSCVIGMDLGGTKILAAVVDEAGEILAEAKTKTKGERGSKVVVQRIAETAHIAAASAGVDWSQIVAIGIGAPGPMNPNEGIVYNPPNLPGWDSVPLGRMLSGELAVPVFLENDVNLGTLGEYALGAGQGTKDLVGIFVGTGVGGGLVLDGKLWGGHRHAAAEIGHMIVMADGPVCGCGKRGCLEALASRTAIERDIWLGIAAGRESIIPKLAGKSKRLPSGMLAKALRRKDPLVSEVMQRAQWYLGLLAATIVNLLDPEIVVFGGGVVEAIGEEFLVSIRTTAYQYFMQQADAELVRIVPAALGDHSAVLGAAVLARQKVGSP